MTSLLSSSDANVRPSTLRARSCSVCGVVWCGVVWCGVVYC
jgi:hypothetical protein